MNKKLTTLLFLVVATLFNIVIIVVLFIVGFVLLGQFVLPVVSAPVGQILLIVLFCGVVVAGYIIYSKTLRWMQKRYNTDKFLTPIFKPKRRN